jgi:hypothetical protein
MTTTQLLANFDSISDASGAIQRLRCLRVSLYLPHMCPIIADWRKQVFFLATHSVISKDRKTAGRDLPL